MNQEVLNESKEKELEFIICPDSKHKQCPKCKKIKRNKCFSYNRVLKMDLCFQCNRSTGSNPFYNPDFGKKRDFVGIRSLSNQEKNMIIKKYEKRGYSYLEAKKKLEYELGIVGHQKITKVLPECQESPNLDIKIVEKSQLNKSLVEGLGMKRR